MHVGGVAPTYGGGVVVEGGEWVEAGLIGLLVGDALGVPYEFHRPDGLPPRDRIEMDPPPGFRRAHAGVPPGTWSDDGAQALVLLDSLLANDGLDLAHFADGLSRWLHDGLYAVDDRTFDVGIQTSRAIRRFRDGMAPELSGPAKERDNGNGALMRVLPLVLWHRGDDAQLVQLAMRQGLPTHGHVRSQLCCAMYCLWARQVLEGTADAWAQAASQLRKIVAGQVPANELSLVLEPWTGSAGTGYVLDTLWSARRAVEQTDSYEDCVRHAIALGHDTDTTACVAGGVAGLKYGLASIPQRWRAALRGMELVRPLLERSASA